jgi:hypothetical protein
MFFLSFILCFLVLLLLQISALIINNVILHRVLTQTIYTYIQVYAIYIYVYPANFLSILTLNVYKKISTHKGRPRMNNLNTPSKTFPKLYAIYDKFTTKATQSLLR